MNSTWNTSTLNMNQDSHTNTITDNATLKSPAYGPPPIHSFHSPPVAPYYHHQNWTTNQPPMPQQQQPPNYFYPPSFPPPPPNFHPFPPAPVPPPGTVMPPQGPMPNMNNTRNNYFSHDSFAISQYENEWVKTAANTENRSYLMDTLSSYNQKEKDEDLVKEWLRKWKKPVPTQVPTKGKSTIHLPDAKLILKDGFMALNDLSVVLMQLKEGLDSTDESLWKYRQRRAIKLKEKLKDVTSQLNQYEPELVRKMKRIAAKRKRVRIKKLALQEEDDDKIRRREELHRQLDLWQKKIYEEDKERERDKKLKEEADTILSEVRKKQAETKKSLELIEALQKLRQLRKSATERKGLYTTKELDSTFNSKMMQLESMMNSQMTDYQAEEKALRVMLESSREAEEQQENKQFENLVESMENMICESLFGSQEPPSCTDPNFGLWNYYTQAEKDFNSLLEIRKQWDRYLIPEEMGDIGDRIPVTWVYPSEPSSKKWKRALYFKKD